VLTPQILSCRIIVHADMAIRLQAAPYGYMGVPSPIKDNGPMTLSGISVYALVTL
jgi:hypothetical protein